MSLHLLRISEVFIDFMQEIADLLEAENISRLSDEYFLVQLDNEELLKNPSVSRFFRFCIPVGHSWPCNPEKMDGFIEKAAQSLYYKFESKNPQTILVGQLDPGSPKRYYRALASNLRGRALQVFELPETNPKTAEDQDSKADTLFCFVGKKGLFAGVISPREAGGLHPGGTKFIAQNEADTVSRAGAKVAEGLHFLSMYRKPLWEGAHWLELGASPGGMTSELLKRGFRVSAIDRAPLDPKVAKHTQLKFFKQNVADFVPPGGTHYEAILCDMNGDPRSAIEMATRLKDFLGDKGLLIFTLKTTGVENLLAIDQLEKNVIGIAAGNGFELITQTHLTYNRQEFTYFFERA